MMESFKPTGWLGLILGTRMYYRFYPQAAAGETDDAFMQQMNALTREIGDRGKPKLADAGRMSEAIPPAPAPGRPVAAPAAATRYTVLAPAAPAPAPAAPPVATTKMRAMMSATPERSFSPSVQMSPMPEQQMGTFGVSGVNVAGLFWEQRTFMERQQMLLIERDQKVRAEMDEKIERQRAEMRAEMEKQRDQAERERAEMDAKIVLLTPTPPQEAVSEQQLTALQARLEGLHATKLLADEELFALEDLIADWVELRASAPAGQVIDQQTIYADGGRFGCVVKLHTLVAVSEAVAGDAALARQVRRKFL